MPRGIFITFEGGEGCGKSSHINALAKYFDDKNIPYVLTREPGGTRLGEKIRELLLSREDGAEMSARSEILLFEAARAEHVEHLIKPALNDGKIVICDRFADSTTAYQGAARMIDAQSTSLLNSFATGGLKPDLTIVLDIPVIEGLARAKSRDRGASDRMGSQKSEFYEKVRRSFLELAKLEPERFAIVDSSGEKSETFAKILSIIKNKFNV